jgi:large subunit ribosomal protein L19
VKAKNKFYICTLFLGRYNILNIVMSDLLKFVEQESAEKRTNIPSFKAGDTINVHVKIKEGNKERIQQFQGTVIQRRHPNTNGETFTVRKISNGIGVERIFPLLSPNIEKIEVVRRGVVRRARLFYLRSLQGKAARIKEKR